MSDNPRMQEGKPGSLPATINWWVDVSQSSIILRAKHSDDSSDQAIMIIERGPDGFIASSRNLFTSNLCAALGIERQSSLPVFNEARKDAPHA